jgi:hypothetical protein
MPTLIINDTLQSYAPGPGQPAGFQLKGIVFNSEFINFNTIRPPRPSPGWYERQGIGYFLFGGPAQYPVDTQVSLFPVTDTSVFWATWGPPGVGVLSLRSLSATPPYDGPTPLSFRIEDDYSLSSVIPGVPTINSLKQVYYLGIWQFWQVNCSLGLAVVSGVTIVTVAFTVIVDGVVVLSSLPVNSGIPAASMYLGSNVINAWQFLGPQPGAYFGEFAIYDGLQPHPFYPNQAVTVNMRASQFAMEHARVPLVNNIRASQMIVETIQKPGNRNMRASQMIVEIILNGAFNPTGGFYVRES